MPLDICSVTHGDTRRFSFMSVAMGLMCDIDLGEYSQKFLRQGFPLIRSACRDRYGTSAMVG
jgi:hypothetical protein